MSQLAELPLRAITSDGSIALDRQEMSFAQFCALLTAVAAYLDTATPENCPWFGSASRRQVAEIAMALLKTVGQEAFEAAWARLDGVLERPGA